MKQTRRLDEEENLRIQRTHQIELMKAKLEDDLKRFEMVERERQADRRHELERITAIANLGVEALISVSGPEQAKVLAELRKNENLKGMTEEQILAAAAADSPDVARALQEKFRAMAEGNLTERERKLYEDLLGDHKEELNRFNEMWTKMAEREKETSRHAMDRMADVAQSFARGQGGTPVVITGPGGGVIRTTGLSASEAGSETKNCPKCGRFVNAEARFCLYCGNEFEGVK
jgi:broad specificity phosphatase PhoE